MSKAQRVWYITITDENNIVQWQTLYDRDEVSGFLLGLDIKGYFIHSWTFNCDYGSSYLVRVELEVRFGNFCVDNIAELLERIIGEE